MNELEIARKLGEQTAIFLKKKTPKVDLESNGVRATDGKGGSVFVPYPNRQINSGTNAKR